MYSLIAQQENIVELEHLMKILVLPVPTRQSPICKLIHSARRVLQELIVQEEAIYLQTLVIKDITATAATLLLLLRTRYVPKDLIVLLALLGLSLVLLENTILASKESRKRIACLARPEVIAARPDLKLWKGRVTLAITATVAT